MHSHFFGQSSFATRVDDAGSAAWSRSPDDAPLELLGPLACGLSTGAGAVFNALAPPAGSSIAIFGTGAVGLAALLAARERGCTRIVGIDQVPARLSLATEFGATDTIDAGRPTRLTPSASSAGATASTSRWSAPATSRCCARPSTPWPCPASAA